MFNRSFESRLARIRENLAYLVDDTGKANDGIRTVIQSLTQELGTNEAIRANAKRMLETVN